MNAFAERFIGSARRERLSKVIPLGRGHLWELLRQFAAHYHEERAHQGLGNKLIYRRSEPANTNGEVTRG